MGAAEVINSAHGKARRPLLFEAWSSDPEILEQQIALISGKYKPRSNLKPKKRTATKTWDVPEEQRFWTHEPWQDAYIARLSRWVRCAEDFKADRNSWRCRREMAVDYMHLTQNCAYRLNFISADLDHADGVARCMSSKVPPPNFICENPANGHVHATWVLYKAVWEMNPKACSIACSIERAITRRLDGDIAFSMTGLCKNPLHDWWNVIRPREEPYTLEELSGFFNAKEMKPWTKKEKRTGYGRNVFVFDGAGEYGRGIVLDCKRKDWHGSEFAEHIYDTAWDMNLAAPFAYPLSRNEVADIAEKVAGWTWRYFSEDGLRRWYIMKGKAGAAKRWRDHIPAVRTACEQDVSRATLYRRKGSAVPPISLSSPDIAIVSPGVAPKAEPLSKSRPWEAEGIDRATWFRRQAKARAAA